MDNTNRSPELRSEAPNNLKSRIGIARKVRREEHTPETYFGWMTKNISGKAAMDRQYGTRRLTNHPSRDTPDP